MKDEFMKAKTVILALMLTSLLVSTIAAADTFKCKLYKTTYSSAPNMIQIVPEYTPTNFHLWVNGIKYTRISDWDERGVIYSSPKNIKSTVWLMVSWTILKKRIPGKLTQLSTHDGDTPLAAYNCIPTMKSI